MLDRFVFVFLSAHSCMEFVDFISRYSYCTVNPSSLKKNLGVVKLQLRCAFFIVLILSSCC